MSKLEDLPDQVRTQASKMRALIQTIESAPLNEVVPAIAKLKEEMDQLVHFANMASGRRI